MAKLFYKETTSESEHVSLKEGLIAWIPFILILLFVLLTSSLFPGIEKSISSIKTVLTIYTGPGAKPYSFLWTGSDTSTNILFGPLQVQVANNLHMSPYWLAAANTGGATAGKMISPQSIAVAAAATGSEPINIGLACPFF